MATTAAETIARSSGQGWQHALTTTLQRQLPALAIAYYLSRYEPINQNVQQKDTPDRGSDESLLLEQYERKLTELLKNFSEALIHDDINDLPKKLKNDYNDLVKLYDIIKNPTVLTPAQELCVQYIAYKLEGAGFLRETLNFAALEENNGKYQLRKYIRQYLREPTILVIQQLKRQGFTISDDSQESVMSLLQQDQEQGDILLKKIFDATKHYQQILDQQAKEGQLRKKTEPITSGKSLDDLLEETLEEVIGE